MNEREQMVKVLKEIVVPKVRNMGFKGSFPHFRRENENVINLITFQFDKWGGGFVIELANCSLDGVTMTWGEKISPKKVTAHDVNVRYRLGAKDIKSDYWFRYDKKLLFGDVFKKTALNVMKSLGKSDEWFNRLPVYK